MNVACSRRTASPTRAPSIIQVMRNDEVAIPFVSMPAPAKAKAPARSLVSIEDVGIATAFLAHDAARLITGETLYVDGGYHIID